MLTREQLGIMHCISTILFQEYNTRTKEGLKYWKRDFSDNCDDYRRTTLRDDDGTPAYNFYTMEFGDSWFIGIDSVSYDEYGHLTDETPIGFIRVDQERACWDIWNYVAKAEILIGHGLLL